MGEDPVDFQKLVSEILRRLIADSDPSYPDQAAKIDRRKTSKKIAKEPYEKIWMLVTGSTEGSEKLGYRVGSMKNPNPGVVNQP